MENLDKHNDLIGDADRAIQNLDFKAMEEIEKEMEREIERFNKDLEQNPEEGSEYRQAVLKTIENLRAKLEEIRNVLQENGANV